MPRSKVRPNVSTYHEAIFMVLEADGSFPGVPLTKSEDKFTAKGVTYLAGRFGLSITAKIQDLYKEVVVIYGLPGNFLTMVRAMQQLYQGVEIPASYGTLRENIFAVQDITNNIRQMVSRYEDDDCVDEDDVIEGELDQPTEEDPEAAAYEEAARRKAYEELAAANPLAAAFARMIINSPDIEEDEDDDNRYTEGGTWGYSPTPGYDGTDDDYSEE